jgi:hypothetical protein
MIYKNKEFAYQALFAALQKLDIMAWILGAPAMTTESGEFVIVGVTASGRPFRPSDWAERLCGCLSVFGEDQRIRYSPYVKPVVADGIKCVVVNRRLEDLDPIAYCFLMSFAKDNELQLRDGRSRARAREAPPVAAPNELAA